MTKQRVYKVIFANNGKIFEIYARRVNSSEMYGFVEVEEIVFGEKTTLVVDPAEEQLKLEFSGVSKTHIPFHTVIRIDEVEREGKGKVLQLAAPVEGAVAVSHPATKPDFGPGKV